MTFPVFKYGGKGVDVALRTEYDPPGVFWSRRHNSYVLVADPERGPWNYKGKRVALVSVNAYGEMRWDVRVPIRPGAWSGTDDSEPATKHFGLTPWVSAESNGRHRMVRRNSEGGFVVSGPEGVSAYRMLALKSMLKLEMLGMKHSRGSAFATIKREYGLKGSKQSVLAQFEKMCAAVVEHRAKPPGFNPLTRREQGKVLGLAAQAGKRYERYDERNVEDDFYSGSALGKQSAYKHVARRFGPRKSVRKNPGGCYCLIRHAITAAERAQVKKQLDYFRSVGDTRGTMFSVAQLGKCSSSGKTARKNSYAIAYAKVVSGGKAVARVEPYLYKDKKLAGVVARHHQYSGVAHIPGAPDSGNLMVNRKRKRSRYGKAMSEKLRGLALALRHEHEKRRKGSRKNAPNLSTSRHAAATWKAGDAAHKFLSHMDGRNLSLFRDVSMWDFMMGNQKATTARKACAGTVLDRYNQFINVVNALWPQIQKKEISKVPLRIAAGSWGMMEQMRSDF